MSLHDQHYAEVRRDIGLARVETSAGRTWVERAAEMFQKLPVPGEPFLVEDVREGAYMMEFIEPPPNEKAWGAAVQLARRRGWVRPIGYAPANSSNRSPKVRWEIVRG